MSVLLSEIIRLPEAQTTSLSPQVHQAFSISTAFKLGLAHILCGLLAIIFSIITIILRTALYFTGTGIWTGCLFFIAGVLGVLCYKHGFDYCTVVSFMLLSIISSVSAFVLLIVSSLAVIADGFLVDEDKYWFKIYRISNVVLVLVAVIEAVLAIKSSANCTKVVCYGKHSHRRGGVYYLPCQVQTEDIDDIRATRRVTILNLPCTPGTVYSVPPGSFIVQQPRCNTSSENVHIFPNAPPVSAQAPPVYVQAPPPYTPNRQFFKEESV